MNRKDLVEQIRIYTPWNEQEERDKEIILRFLETNDDAFLRSNAVAHMTASAWVVNRPRTRVLLAYHKIYDSWTWTGGHADGEEDLLSVALREVQEETGVKNVSPVTRNIYSIETLTVDGHEKHGKYVPSHLHMNVTFLLEADESDALTVRTDENTGVGWFAKNEVFTVSSEPWFNKRIFTKLNEKLAQFPEGEEEELLCICPFCREEVPLKLLPNGENKVWCPHCRKLFAYEPLEEEYI